MGPCCGQRISIRNYRRPDNAFWATHEAQPGSDRESFGCTQSRISLLQSRMRGICSKKGSGGARRSFAHPGSSPGKSRIALRGVLAVRLRATVKTAFVPISWRDTILRVPDQVARRLVPVVGLRDRARMQANCRLRFEAPVWLSGGKNETHGIPCPGRAA
jgi:hypothetical protein